MHITAKTEYACIAILELASDVSKSPVRIKFIAEKHGIPSRFLVQILLQLKNAGIVDSTRGAAGGYRLIADPTELTIANIIEAVEGKTSTISNIAANQTPICRELNRYWQSLSSEFIQRLEKTTIADLTKRIEHDSEIMYYI